MNDGKIGIGTTSPGEKFHVILDSSTPLVPGNPADVLIKAENTNTTANSHASL